MGIGSIKLSKCEAFVELFKRGNFDMFTGGINYKGDNVKHEKQDTALCALTDDLCNYILYGGCIGGGKSELGAFWVLMMCLAYPGARVYVARNELNKILDSCYVSIKDVAKRVGYSDFTFNANKNYLKFSNGSILDFIEVKYKPSDPLFEDLGSVPYTAGWIEEGGEIHEDGMIKLLERTGRYKNTEYGLKKKVLITCNPKKNWMYREYYLPFKLGTLDNDKVFVESFIDDNPFLSDEYKDSVRKMYATRESDRKRLLEGNWDYDTTDDLLCDYNSILGIFENDHVDVGRAYLSCDAARFGSDLAVILIWMGWVIVDFAVYEKSKVTDLVRDIELFRRRYRIPKNRCIADEDGVGGGVVDICGILGFVNQKPPIANGKNNHNYNTIQDQCLYMLSDKINDGSVWFKAATTGSIKDRIVLELDQIRSVVLNNGRLSTKPKIKIREDIKGSPDWRDAMSLRCYFDLNPPTRNLISFIDGF